MNNRRIISRFFPETSVYDIEDSSIDCLFFIGGIQFQNCEIQTRQTEFELAAAVSYVPRNVEKQLTSADKWDTADILCDAVDGEDAGASLQKWICILSSDFNWKVNKNWFVVEEFALVTFLT